MKYYRHVEVMEKPQQTFRPTLSLNNHTIKKAVVTLISLDVFEVNQNIYGKSAAVFDTQ